MACKEFLQRVLAAVGSPAMCVSTGRMSQAASSLCCHTGNGVRPVAVKPQKERMKNKAAEARPLLTSEPTTLLVAMGDGARRAATHFPPFPTFLALHVRCDAGSASRSFHAGRRSSQLTRRLLDSSFVSIPIRSRKRVHLASSNMQRGRPRRCDRRLSTSLLTDCQHGSGACVKRIRTLLLFTRVRMQARTRRQESHARRRGNPSGESKRKRRAGVREGKKTKCPQIRQILSPHAATQILPLLCGKRNSAHTYATKKSMTYILGRRKAVTH